MLPPRPRQMDSWQAAEVNAAEWMRWWGHSDAAVTPGGPDAGIDVQSSTALAQVKWEAAQTGAPALQRLVGARRTDHDKILFFFSGAGFSRHAVDYADDMDIALFKFDLTGNPTPMSLAAHRVVLRHERESGITQDRARRQEQGPGRSAGATKETSKRDLPGRGWLGRNWTGVVSAFFLIQALRNGLDVMRDRADPAIDWYDPVISLLVGVVFAVVFFLSRGRRAEWKRLREGASQASPGGGTRSAPPER